MTAAARTRHPRLHGAARAPGRTDVTPAAAAVTFRRRAVAVQEQLRHERFTQRDIARGLNVAERTLRAWSRHDRLNIWPLRAPGRPPQPATTQQRNRVVRSLRETGPTTSVAALRRQFPDMRRVEIEALARRFRALCRRRLARQRHRLEWTRPHAVWALDFAEPSDLIDGRCGDLIAVRDLASRQQLAWAPVADQTAATAIAALDRLFAEHGPPLVLKIDNGAAFRAADFKEFLSGHGVAPLHSPRRRPKYNGGVERANQTLKAGTIHQARRRGSIDQWSAADVERARQFANQTTRPWGKDGPAPLEAWQQREPLEPDHRQHFAATLARLRAELGPAPATTAGSTDGHYIQSAHERRALSKALQQTGLLILHPARPRRRLPAPKLRPPNAPATAFQSPQPERLELQSNKFTNQCTPNVGPRCTPPVTISKSRVAGQTPPLGERLVHFGQGLIQQIGRLIPPANRSPKAANIRDG